MDISDMNARKNALAVSIRKTRQNITRLADEPKAYSALITGNYVEWKEGFFEITNWTSSFFTGMALLGFQLTKDLELLKQETELIM